MSQMPEPQWQLQQEPDNCFWACLASLLAMPQSELPFSGACQTPKDMPPLQNWLRSIGYDLQYKVVFDSWFMRLGKFTEPYIASLVDQPVPKPTKFFTRGKGFTAHAVIMQKDRIIWDPSPSPTTPESVINDPISHRVGIFKILPLS